MKQCKTELLNKQGNKVKIIPWQGDKNITGG